MTTCNERQATVWDRPKVAFWKVAGTVPRWVRPDVLRAFDSSDQDRCDPFPRVVEADIARGLYIDRRAGRVTFAE